jgi:DNA-binding response OmpR family regulator
MTRKSCILLIEDNAVTRRLVRLALKNEDYEIVEAEGGTAALALLANHRPDLILQDLVLPDMDGFVLVQKLRQHPAAIGMPILAFTVPVSSSDEARFANAGFDGLITKPVEPSKLLYVVRGHLPVRSRTSTASTARRSRS